MAGFSTRDLSNTTDRWQFPRVVWPKEHSNAKFKICDMTSWKENWFEHFPNVGKYQCISNHVASNHRRGDLYVHRCEHLVTSQDKSWLPLIMDKHDQSLQNVLYQVSVRSPKTPRKPPGQNIRPLTSQNTEHHNEKLGLHTSNAHNQRSGRLMLAGIH